jgi:site-specific DNA-cytosine methylase
MVSNSFGDRIMRGIQGNSASLFCEAGGLDLGFTCASIEIFYAADFNTLDCVTYAVNTGLEASCRDVAEVNRQLYRLGLYK